MKFFYLFFCVALCFFACSENKEIGVKVECDYEYKPPIRDVDEYDNFFPLQWHLQSTHNFSINIAPAWEITKGRGVKVAVIDNDFQKEHEDFENIEVYNVIDDGNSCDPVKRSEYSHGTAVSGVVAARQNVVGTMGVAPECDLLFVGGNDDYFYEDAQLIKAFDYAQNWGADVINCSWGTYNVSSVLESLLEGLYENGTVIIFACGNDRKNLDNVNIRDESELPWVIGVSRSNEYGVLSSGSDFGSNLDIMAPGDRILAPDLMGAEGSNNHNGEANENYGYRSGASFSAPIVSGVAALILAANPTLTVDEIYQIITQTAKKTGDESMYDANGFSLRHAYGLIDAGNAVRRAAGLCPTSISE
ncbi:MAG: S8 family serine peptidase [Chitinivibrionia bacterium]|nr:S8 family serine peptidase [Chitinivibrionia bacterium]